MLLGDTKNRGLKFEPSDPLGARDPESVVTEREVLRILADLIEASAKPGAANGTRSK
jgi:hypothetical protein